MNVSIILLILCVAFFYQRFDNELHIKAGDIAGERNMRDHLQKERDQLLKQKYLLTQQLEVRISRLSI